MFGAESPGWKIVFAYRSMFWSSACFSTKNLSSSFCSTLSCSRFRAQSLSQSSLICSFLSSMPLSRSVNFFWSSMMYFSSADCFEVCCGQEGLRLLCLVRRLSAYLSLPGLLSSPSGVLSAAARASGRLELLQFRVFPRERSGWLRSRSAHRS